MKSKEKPVVIITGLPFRKQGNQSLIRFVNMFLNHEFGVTMYSAGRDSKGKYVIGNPYFTFFRIKSLEISFTTFLNSLATKLNGSSTTAGNYFDQIKSEDIVPPYGNYNLMNLVNKWMKLIFRTTDNIILFFYLVLFQARTIRKSCVIVGYEASFTMCSRWLSKVFRKKYINKYQGTILKATNRNLSLALKYFPNNFFSINKSDLCLMVQDGTDGEYYARLKGCDNILFEPHGVFQYSHERSYDNNIVDELKRQNKFVIFNNASGSTWKRTDRVIRSLLELDKDILENISLVTTYHAQNKNDLVDFVQLKGLEENVIFVEKIDSFESNYIIQKADLVIMTNDFSNLGNPILEAIYYKTPIISIDDGSLEGFVTNNVNSLLIKLDSEFDKNMANAIQKMYKDEAFYDKLKKNMNNKHQVRELSEQQDREFKVINELLKGC